MQLIRHAAEKRFSAIIAQSKIENLQRDVQTLTQHAHELPPAKKQINHQRDRIPDRLLRPNYQRATQTDHVTD